MDGSDAVKFFDTSGCLNLTRPTSGTPVLSPTHHRNERRRPVSSSISRRGQLKIDLYNFDHIDFVDSKYVLTSPRSLEACARLNIKPITLLPKRLADVQDDIGSEKVRLATLADIRDQIEIDRLARLQRCREERERIIREENSRNPSSRQMIDPQPSSVNHNSLYQRTYADTKFNPSSSLLQGLNQSTTIHSVPTGSQSATTVRHSEYDTNAQIPPRPASSTRPTVANSILKSSTTQWPSSSSSHYEYDNRDNPYTLRPSSSVNFNDDARRMHQNLQHMSTSRSGPNQSNSERYVSGLENVKEMIERRTPYATSETEPTNLTFDKRQHEILLAHYDHELKFQKARENARRVEKEAEALRLQSLLHSLTEQQTAEERRQSRLSSRIGKLQHTRTAHEAKQLQNYHRNMADMQARRYEILTDLKQKDRRSKHFVQEKEEAARLSRSLAKSSQDLREYLRETNENFDEKARKAELTNSVLIKKTKTHGTRRHLQSSLRT